MHFSVIIPVYNESKNISNLAEELFIALAKYEFYEVIFVNDCSTDNSYQVLQNLLNKFSFKIIDNKKNLGQSFSIISGIKQSKYDTIVTLDADGQNNPKDIPKMLNKYFSDNIIFLVGGIRKKRRDSYIKIFSSKIANNIRSFILNDDCIDSGCSLKVFDKKLFLSFPFFNGIHRFLPALFKGFDKKTCFLDVDHRPRMHGYSKYGTFGRLFKGIYDLIRVLIIIKKYKNNRAWIYL